VQAAAGTLVALTIKGEAGGRWYLVRAPGHWQLCLGVRRKPHAEAILDQEDAWRLFTKGLDPREARARASVLGDQTLARKVLATVSIIA
jgi:hypothetical protein